MFVAVGNRWSAAAHGDQSGSWLDRSAGERCAKGRLSGRRNVMPGGSAMGSRSRLRTRWRPSPKARLVKQVDRRPIRQYVLDLPIATLRRVRRVDRRRGAAVGDKAFEEKSLAKIEEIRRGRHSRTVSRQPRGDHLIAHGGGLEQGELKTTGTPADVVAACEAAASAYHGGVTQSLFRRAASSSVRQSIGA